MEIFSLLTEAIKRYDFSSFITLAIILLCAFGVKMAIDIFKDSVKENSDTNKRLLVVNHDIHKNSNEAIAALSKVFQEFSIGEAYNHKEVVSHLDRNHKEVVLHFDDIKKKIELLHHK